MPNSIFDMAYSINPTEASLERITLSCHWTNNYNQDIEIYEQLGNAKAALARLHGRSIAIPNQGLLINSISYRKRRLRVHRKYLQG